MEEQCILVDQNDRVVGHNSKKMCHSISQDGTVGILHRAFSVFLFNSSGKLLLQQRSPAKITFPCYFTNTCCSHPLYLPEELEEEKQLGVRSAAQRKLLHELGIPPEQVPLQSFQFLTRIHYQASSCNQWGEHEIDYILFIQQDVDITANPNEVMSYQYIDQEQLRSLLEDGMKGKVLVTPWFRLICDHFLFHWWDRLKNLSSVQDHANIHRLL